MFLNENDVGEQNVMNTFLQIYSLLKPIYYFSSVTHRCMYPSSQGNKLLKDNLSTLSLYSISCVIADGFPGVKLPKILDNG